MKNGRLKGSVRNSVFAIRRFLKIKGRYSGEATTSAGQSRKSEWLWVFHNPLAINSVQRQKGGRHTDALTH